MRIYFHPRTTKSVGDVQNPYTKNFLATLSSQHTVLNENDPSSIGILKTLKYLHRIDLLVLNWIEDLADKKGGYLQIVYFILLVRYLKLRRKKTLWILHNKLSHHKSNLKAKKFLFKFLIRNSDIIITHANDGVDFAKSFYPKRNIKINFFPHPTIPYPVTKVENKKMDILIWGAISEYKGIDKFLEFLHTNKLENKFKIHIAGKVMNENYKSKILPLCNENIQLTDAFIERDILAQYIQQARLVLFTYSNDSILSSGALIDTLAYKANILGPNTGSFKDLAKDELISVYNNFEELPALLSRMVKEENKNTGEKLEKYFSETSWEKFGITINNILND